MGVRTEQLSSSFFKIPRMLVFFLEQQWQPYGMCARTSICKTALRSLPLPSVKAVTALLSAGCEGSSSRSQGMAGTSGMGWKSFAVPSQKTAAPGTLDGTTAIFLGGDLQEVFSPVYYNTIFTLLLPRSVSALIGLYSNNISLLIFFLLVYFSCALLILKSFRVRTNSCKALCT